MAFKPAPLTATCSRFKPSGKWYNDFELNMAYEQSAPTAPEAVQAALLRGGHRLDRFTYVVMEPAHPLAVPVLIPAAE